MSENPWGVFTDEDFTPPRRRTACRRAGHDWSDPKNVRVQKDGKRRCAECARERDRRRHERYRAENPLKRRVNGAVVLRDERGHKLCIGCNEWLPETAFPPCAGRPDGLNGRCAPCYTAKQRTHKYGISREDWEAMFEAQGRVCAICGTNAPGVREWATDHDHACCPVAGRACGECVRGILCHSCNTGLGYFSDDQERLLAAVAYLKERE